MLKHSEIRIMVIHIGEKIKKRAKELRIGPTELGEMINTSKQNIYGIYKRKSIDTEMLRKLSVALNCDFFEFYSFNHSGGKLAKEPPMSPYNKVEKSPTSVEQEKLKTELENLKEKYDLLKKLNTLLEKGKK